VATLETVVAQSREPVAGGPHLLLSPRQTGPWRFLSRLWFKTALLVITDATAIFSAHYLAETFTQWWLRAPQAFLNPSYYYIFYVPFFVAVFYFLEEYRDFDSRRPEKELELGVKGISFFFVALACANFILFKQQGFSRYLLIFWYVFSIVFILGVRFSLRGLYSTLRRHGFARETALLAGSPNRVLDLRRQFSVQRHFRYDFLGALLEHQGMVDREARLGDLPVLGDLEAWEEIADRLSIRWLILTLSANDFGQHVQAHEIARRCQAKGIAVQVYSDLLGSCEFQYERDEFSGCFHILTPPQWSRALQVAVKTMMDRIVGVIGSLVALVLVPFVAALVKLEDPGPVFYRREFVDQDGATRYYLKFRSMVMDADLQLQSNRALRQQFDHKFKLKHDPRVLRVGRVLRKYSIDEFPQFFSLLTGQLSFVGPRVISSQESDRYGSLLPRLLSVKPGLTGYWQVMGRQNTSYEERIYMDMFYVDHWSIWLDLVIAAKTFWKVLRADGAY